MRLQSIKAGTDEYTESYGEAKFLRPFIDDVV